MITSTFLFIGKIVLILLLIGGMVMILMSIGHIFHTDDLNSTEDDLRLREDIDNSEDVMSEKSVFFNFLPSQDRDEKSPPSKSD